MPFVDPNLVSVATMLRRRQAMRRLLSRSTGGGGASTGWPGGDIVFNWRFRTAAQFVMAGGAPAPASLVMTTPKLYLRGDQPATITTPGGSVSAWTSHDVAGGWPMNPSPAAENRGTHNNTDGFVRLVAASSGDADGDHFSISAMGTQFASNSSAHASHRGVVYLLYRASKVPTHDVTIFRIGANDGGFNFASFRSYWLRISAAGNLEVSRRGDGPTAASIVGPGAMIPNVWIAMALVLNDDRAVEGTSDDVSRLYVKSKTGAWATMQTSVTDVRAVPSHASTQAWVNRAKFNGSTSDGSLDGNADYKVIAFDNVAPRGAGANAYLEANLDHLLALV